VEQNFLPGLVKSENAQPGVGNTKSGGQAAQHHFDGLEKTLETFFSFNIETTSTCSRLSRLPLYQTTN
jgi:hypothetical protein